MSTPIPSPRPGSNPRANRRVAILATSLICFAALSATRAHAEDFPFESGDTASEFEKGFGKDQGVSQADRLRANEDHLKIGGEIWSELNYLHFTGGNAGGLLSNPNSLWLYFDSQLNDDVRALAKFKSIHDPTVSETEPNLFTGKIGEKSQFGIEEMKLLFTVKKRVFFTVGKQKIKWGSGKFWNPTDFLNSERRNFFYSTDLRAGVSQIKTHVPIGASNFYLINGLDDADGANKISHAVRAEVPVGTGEIAASARAKKGSRPIYGLDVSAGVWVFDVYGEVSYTSRSSQTLFGSDGTKTQSDASVTNYVAGISYETAYSDQDTVTFGLEYFRNALGYTSTDPYAFVLAGGEYVPFYLGQQYGMFSIYLPEPGGWNNTTFTLFNVLNLSDRSVMTRLDTVYSGMDDLSIGFALGAHYGDKNGEFRFGGQSVDIATRLMIQF